MPSLPPGAVLALPIAAEVVATSALKASDGFSKAGYVALVAGGGVLNLYGGAH